MEDRAPYGKTDRLSIRISEVDKATLESAAQLSGLSAGGFVVREALAAAQTLLADNTRYVLDDERWDALCARLDKPPRDLPAIRRVAREPSPFDE
jgi:uncharacterized protein (DUF1778 family)